MAEINLNGVWAIVSILATGVVTWIGYLIKDHVDRKKLEKNYRDNQTEKLNEIIDTQKDRLNELSSKIDKVIDWQVDFAKEQNKRLKKLSEGLELSMEDDKLIFQAFRKSELLNGDSEKQSKKLDEYQKSLLKDSFLMADSATEVEELENLTK